MINTYRHFYTGYSAKEAAFPIAMLANKFRLNPFRNDFRFRQQNTGVQPNPPTTGVQPSSTLPYNTPHGMPKIRPKLMSGGILGRLRSIWRMKAPIIANPALLKQFQSYYTNR